MKISKFCAFFFIVLSVLFYCEHCYAFSDERFTNSTDKGNFGEAVTDDWMKSRGFEKLPTKHTGNQGIDGAFVKRNPDGTVQEIRLVESKTDSSPYNPEQMSDKTINEQIEKMRQSHDSKVREAGELLYRNKDRIKKELHHHDTRNGKLTIYKINPGGEQGGVIAGPIDVKKTQERILREREKQKVNKVSEVPKEEPNKAIAKAANVPEGQVKQGAEKAAPIPPAVPIGKKSKNVLKRIVERISSLTSRLTERAFSYLHEICKSMAKFFGKIGKSLSTASSVAAKRVSSFTGTVIEKVSKISGAVGEHLSRFFRPLGKGISHYCRTAFGKISKVLGAAGERLSRFFRPIGKSIPRYYRTALGKMSKVSGTFARKSSGYSQKLLKQISKVPKFCLERLSGAFGRITKLSVAFGIIYSGYSVTKEVYEKAMKGEPVHPSRVIARAIIGFAGGSGGAALLAVLLVAIFTVAFAPAVPVAGFIGCVLGCAFGGIISEWLFEIIMPLRGTGWTVSDFFIGGFFGSLIGLIPGMLIGKMCAETAILGRKAFKGKEKPREKEKKTIWASLKGFFKPTAEDKIRSSFFSKGLRGGFLLGGFSMGLVFVYLFSYL